MLLNPRHEPHKRNTVLEVLFCRSNQKVGLFEPDPSQNGLNPVEERIAYDDPFQNRIANFGQR